MHTWDSVDHYFSGQGVVLLAERNTDGSPKGFVPVGNVPDLKLTVSVSNLEHKESHTGQRGTDKRLAQETKVALSMTLENFIASNLARVSRGTNTSVEAATVTDAPYTVYEDGGITGLGFLKVSGVVVTTDPGAVALTMDDGSGANWDYRLNDEAGSIQMNTDSGTWDALVAGDFTDGEGAVTVTFDHELQTRIEGLDAGSEELFMRFEGLNTAESNEPVVVEVFKFSTDPFKELSLISDGIQSFVLEGSVLSDATRATGSKYFAVASLA